MNLASSDIYNELEKIQIHDHCCMVYETEDEWQSIINTFILQGLMKGDKCIYVANKRKEDYICECLSDQGIDVSEAIKSGQFLIVRTENIIDKYIFKDFDEVINIYSNYLQSFMDEGYTAIRITSEALFRILGYQSDSGFLELQLRLNRDLFPYYPIISLCQYHRQEDHPKVLKDAVISCKWLLRGYKIYQNLSCITPDFYFQQKDEAWEADYWLRTQEALLESEEKYRLIVEHAMDMITVIDAETLQIKFTSPANSRLMGYTCEEVLGVNCIKLLHPQYRKEAINAFREGILKGEGEGVSLIGIKDGSYRWIESKGKILRKEGTRDKIIIFSRDIHEKKLAEEALLKSQQNYKNQLNYLNTLINTMNEICVTYNRNTEITFVNHRMIETVGYSTEELLGRSILDFIYDKYQETTQMHIYKRLQSGEVSSYENALIRKDGSILFVKLKSSPIIENEEIVGALVLAEDITQQRKLEREMARLGQLNTVGEIAASIGHEIRNPMTTVQGFLQIMSKNKDFKDHQAHFELMLEELGRANSIITEFLTLAKDKLVDLQPLNINKVIQTLAPLMKADAMNGDKNIRLQLNDIPELLLDEKEIRQLILNLVRNGLEAMQKGRTVTIRTCQEDNKVLLSVEDEGEGIAADILDKLGTPFFSTKANGTGLGLAVCYSIVARHNGTISVNSSSEGSTFGVRFPCQ